VRVHRPSAHRTAERLAVTASLGDLCALSQESVCGLAHQVPGEVRVCRPCLPCKREERIAEAICASRTCCTASHAVYSAVYKTPLLHSAYQSCRCRHRNARQPLTSTESTTSKADLNIWSRRSKRCAVFEASTTGRMMAHAWQSISTQRSY
jgi:hypothetical protein